MVEPVIEGALKTPDGYWRVEIVRYARSQRWYRIIHGATVVAEKAPIATVRQVLGEQFADLEPADAA